MFYSVDSLSIFTIHIRTSLTTFMVINNCLKRIKLNIENKEKKNIRLIVDVLHRNYFGFENKPTF